MKLPLHIVHDTHFSLIQTYSVLHNAVFSKPCLPPTFVTLESYTLTHDFPAQSRKKADAETVYTMRLGHPINLAVLYVLTTHTCVLL